ncbi:hypothetical protein PPACK8108_LOCUS9138 [Phakopsora pachyrhizi]|uniref:Uncharacterized protein n=1 Tax=Phakopsora pachyrhizi TaxID=170000 RepID=A0AAV0AVY0_PHAPC|nr:hypothetical protein PPACK8108_LOCUS9138 [Phakopsora pachyrhizi]
MPDIDEVFKSIEAFEMKMEWLTSSKLGKVLKQVGALDNSKVPLDEKDKGRGDAHQTGTAVVSKEDEKKDDDTEAKDQEKGDLKAAEGKSDKDEIKEDGKKMDCSDSPQPETTKAGKSEEFYQFKVQKNSRDENGTVMIKQAQFLHNPVIYKRTNTFAELEKDRESSFMGWMLMAVELWEVKNKKIMNQTET